MNQEFQVTGYAIRERVIPEAVVQELRDAVEDLPEVGEVKRRAGRVYGARHLFRLSPAIENFARSSEMLAVVRELAGAEGFPVRSLFFDKVEGANWSAGWHQDLTIVVKERREVLGYGPWSDKNGIPHVQPPAEVLRRMVTLRVHLDDCTADNGALRVIPGSHRDGVLDDAALEERVRSESAVTCEVGAGGIVAMCPLMLHASSPAESPRHRRVVHIEYAVDELPGGLEWFEGSKLTFEADENS